MSFTFLPLLTTGDWIDAAWGNTYWRDNFAAVWPYTTAGDLAYATGATALARLGLTVGGVLYGGASAPAWLAKPSVDSVLKNTSAGVPSWVAISDLTQEFASVYHNTTQNVGTGSATALAFNSEISDLSGWHSTVSNTSRITVGATGNYMVSAWFIYTTGGGSGNYSDYVNINRNGSSVGSFRALQEKDANGKHFLVTIPIIGANAGQYFEVTLEQNSGETAVVANGARFSVLRVS